jgi:carboxyl-terminal processing protease
MNIKGAVVFIALVFSPGLFTAGERELVDNSYKKLNEVMESLDYINKTYVDEEKIISGKLLYGAIKGMLATLDPYSVFMEPEEYKEMRSETSGNYSGIGVEITIKNEILTVVSPFEKSPGWKKGLRPGDKILKIDGVSTKNMTTNDAVKKIRGLKGTPVVLSVFHENADKAEDVEIIRDNIKIQSVMYYINDDNIGYIRLRQFIETSEGDIAKAVAEMETKKAKGIILDLRNNPGGLLSISASISDRFLPADKLIVYTQGRDKNSNKKYTSKGGNQYAETVPLVVLVNKGSASASEIVTGALQDNKRAVIMGTKTFGKGSVQSVFSMGDGSGLRLTTAYYYTPSGKKIHEKGIEPDITEEDYLFTETYYKLRYFDHFTNYAKKYVKDNAKIDLKKLVLDDKAVDEFAREVRAKGFILTDVDTVSNKEVIKKQLRIEIVRALDGEEAGEKETVEQDEVVKKAEDLLKAFRVFKATEAK